MKDDSEEEEKHEETTLIYKVRKNDTWIIDSGCTHHMTSDIEKFDRLDEYDGGSIRMGNDAPCMVRGKGSLMINDRIKCENAYWVDGLNYNLLSVAQLNNSGH